MTRAIVLDSTVYNIDNFSKRRVLDLYAVNEIDDTNSLNMITTFLRADNQSITISDIHTMVLIYSDTELEISITIGANTIVSTMNRYFMFSGVIDSITITNNDVESIVKTELIYH